MQAGNMAATCNLRVASNREIKRRDDDHTASKCQRWNLKPSLYDAKNGPLATMQYCLSLIREMWHGIQSPENLGSNFTSDTLCHL